MLDEFGNNVSTQLTRLIKEREQFFVSQQDIALAGGWSLETVRLLEERMKEKVTEKTLLRYRGAFAAILLQQGINNKAKFLIKDGVYEAVVATECPFCDGLGFSEDPIDGDEICYDCLGTGFVNFTDAPHPQDLEDILE